MHSRRWDGAAHASAAQSPRVGAEARRWPPALPQQQWSPAPQQPQPQPCGARDYPVAPYHDQRGMPTPASHAAANPHAFPSPVRRVDPRAAPAQRVATPASAQRAEVPPQRVEVPTRQEMQATTGVRGAPAASAATRSAFPGVPHADPRVPRAQEQAAAAPPASFPVPVQRAEPRRVPDPPALPSPALRTDPAPPAQTFPPAPRDEPRGGSPAAQGRALSPSRRAVGERYPPGSGPATLAAAARQGARTPRASAMSSREIQSRQTALALWEAELHTRETKLRQERSAQPQKAGGEKSPHPAAAWGWLGEHEQVVEDLKALLSRHRTVLASIGSGSPQDHPAPPKAEISNAPRISPARNARSDEGMGALKDREQQLKEREDDVEKREKDAAAREDWLRKRQEEQAKTAEEESAAVAARAAAVAAREAAVAKREEAAAAKETDVSAKLDALSERLADVAEREKAVAQREAAAAASTRIRVSPPASPRAQLPASPRSPRTASPRSGSPAGSRRGDPDSPKWMEGHMNQINPDCIASWVEAISTEASEREERELDPPAGCLLCDFEEVASPIAEPVQDFPGEEEEEEEEDEEEAEGEQRFRMLGMVQHLMDDGLLPPHIMEALELGQIEMDDVVQMAAEMGVQFVGQDADVL